MEFETFVLKVCLSFLCVVFVVVGIMNVVIGIVIDMVAIIND